MSLSNDLENEARAVWELSQKGIIREIYFRGDQHTAVLVLERQDIHQARAIISTFQLVKQSLVEFDVFALVPYDGFARLFASK